jgi:hypothetical protein
MVADEIVAATQPLLPVIVADMVRLHRLMRQFQRSCLIGPAFDGRWLRWRMRA